MPVKLISRLCVLVLTLAMAVLVYRVTEHVFPFLLHAPAAVVPDEAYQSVKLQDAGNASAAKFGSLPDLMDETTLPASPIPASELAAAAAVAGVASAPTLGASAAASVVAPAAPAVPATALEAPLPKVAAKTTAAP